METLCLRTHKQVDPIENILFVIQTGEDIKQDEKHVPDQLEAMMRLTVFVKEELRRILCTVRHFRSKISKIRVSAFGIPEI